VGLATSQDEENSMKKILLASTCAMAFAISASGLSFAQGTQRNDEKTGAGQEQMQPGAQHKATGQAGERMNAPSPRAETQPQPGENRSNAAAAPENKNRSNAAQSEMNKENKNRSNAATEQENKNPSNAAAAPENKNRSNAAQGEMNKENKNRSNAATDQENKNRSNAQGEMNKNAPLNAQEEKSARPGETRTQSGQATQHEMNEQPKGAAQGATGGQERNQANAQSEGRVKLNQSQAADFRGRIEKHGGGNAAIAANVDVRVGAPIPESVRFEPLPIEIIAVYPQFRGYDYVMRGDEIVIIEPRTREVVEIIGGEGRAAAERYPRYQRFSREQDEIFRRDIHVERNARVDFDEGRMDRVPDTIVLEPLPPDVVEAVPDVREYRYFVDLNDHIVVVDPRTHEIVDIID
jgi:hypothetical protein